MKGLKVVRMVDAGFADDRQIPQTGAQSSEYDLWCPWMIMQFRGVFAVDRPTKAGISPHITKGGYSFDLIQPVIWQI